MKKLKTILFLTLIGVLNIAQINAQTTVLGNASGIGVQYGGWDGVIGTTPKDYDLRNYHQGFNINFFTTPAAGALTQRATILGSGNFGIGTLTPVTILDILPTVTNTGYGMFGISILHNWGANNIFVGEGAGTTNSGSQNTGVGFGAGNVNVGVGNVFIGHRAGNLNTTGDLNTFTGSWAGPNNTTGQYNSFFGHHAGLGNTTGSENTYLGYHAASSGTTGNKNSVVGNDAAFNLSTGSENTFMGFESDASIRTGNYNTAIGAYSGRFNQDNHENVCIGFNAGRLNRADFNTFVGSHSGAANTSATGQTFVGYNSGLANTTGADNTFMGYEAGSANATGTRNVYTGHHAGLSSTGDDNAFMGYNAGMANTGSQNTIMGSLAGVAATGATGSTYIGYLTGMNADGDVNTMVGSYSGLNNTTGYGNSFLGNKTGVDITDGFLNTYIGFEAGTTSANPSIERSTAIGANAIVMNSDHMILGNNVNVGIGLSGDPTGPTNMLEIKSDASSPTLSGLTFTNLFKGIAAEIPPYGQVLTVDIDGNVVLTDDGPGAAANGTSLSGTTVELGNSVGGTAATLSSNREIPMDNKVVFFSDPAPGAVDGSYNAVGVGGPPVNAKFEVSRNISDIKVITPIAVQITSIDESFSYGSSYGLKCDVSGLTNRSNLGGYFSAMNGNSNTAVKGISIGAYTPTYNIENKGGEFTAADARDYNYGLYSNAARGLYAYGAKITVSDGTRENYGAKAIVSTSSSSSTAENYGFSSEVTDAGNSYRYNYGFKTKVSTSSTMSAAYNIGFDSEASSVSTGPNGNIGGQFKATGVSGANYGVYCYASSGTVNATNCGVAATGAGGQVNYGVWGNAPTWSPPGTVFNVGVYGYAPRSYTVPTVPLPTGSWAGYFVGDVAFMGYQYIPSDSTIKKNISEFKDAGSILNQVNCYSYYYDSTKYGDHVNLPKKLQYGFLAQEVEAASPELVQNGCLPPKIDSLGNILVQTQGVMMIDYTRFVPLLLGGYKEQKALIDSLLIRLSNLEATVLNCCGAPRGTNPDPEITGQNNRQHVKLMNSENAILYTNEPNPYTSSTTIRYFIPENTSDVKITFQDATGKTLKEIKVNETGQGSIVVDGSELINGIYTYSLVIGNKIVDTKKMVKQ